MAARQVADPLDLDLEPVGVVTVAHRAPSFFDDLREAVARFYGQC
jgi:hypothetical protein